MKLQQIIRVAMCAAIVALCVAGEGLFPAQSVAGREIQPANLHEAAALERLKQNWQYESLNAALNHARFNLGTEESKATTTLAIDPLFSFKQKLMAADGEAGDTRYCGWSAR